LTVCKHSSDVLYIMSSEPDTKTRILDAALVCAAESRLTMAAVAAQAGLSRQAIYLHFPDRETLLAALVQRLEQPEDMVAAAPSARAAMAAMLARLAADYPKLRPVARLLADGDPWREARLTACRQIAERFRGEGALSRHLSLDTACDLLWSLTGPAVWEDLVMGRGWSAERYRSHVAYLAANAVTK
jgi:AcrR family transcriptional regulator